MKKKTPTVLGLDISTSITGVTVYSSHNIIETLFLDTRNKKKFPTLYEKANFINAVSIKYNIFFNILI